VRAIVNADLSTPTGLPDFSSLDLDFDIVDCHHHLFGLDSVYYPWLTDRAEENFLLGNYDALKANYLPADLQRDHDGLRVVKTVHVEAEADHENSLAETEWLAGIMRTHELPNALVAHAWFHREDSREEMEAQAAYSEVRGIRSKPVTSASADARSDVTGVPGSMEDPAWRQGLGMLRDFDLSWDLRVPWWHLEQAAEVSALYSDLPIVVEHTGLPWDRSDAGLAAWRVSMTRLAALDNVFLKVSELGLAGDPWNYVDNRRVVREAIELFGFERCMFASNFPVAGLRIGFRDQVSAIASMIDDCSQHERQRLFHDTAVQFYRL